MPEHDPTLSVQLSDGAELEALGRCLDAAHEAGLKLVADACDPGMPADAFSREARTYAAVSGACRAAFRAAMAETGGELGQWIEEALRWTRDRKLRI